MSDTENRRLSLLASLEAQIDGSRPEHRRQGRGGEPAEQEQKELVSAAPRHRPDRGRGLRHEAGERASEASRKQELASRSALQRRPDGGAQRLAAAPVMPFPNILDRSRIEGMLQLPQRVSKRSYGTIISFLLFVALPVLVAGFYYIVFASDQYVAEFRFAVRETSSPLTPPSSTTAATTALGSLLGTAVSSSMVENYMVVDYLTSRQVVDELQKRIKVKELYSRPSIDRWARFDPSQPMEKFVEYWQKMVTAQYDMITGIAVARVRAFTPDDAYLIATNMVSLAEKLVNEIAMRSRLDAVRFSEQEVKRAQDRLNEIRAQVGEYRDKEAVIDPTSNVVASNTTLAQTLRATLMQYQTELAALRRQNLRPDAPTIVALQSRIYAARQQLAEVEAQVATAKEGNRPLSHVVGQYEKLELERQVAQNILTSAIQTLEQARVNASVQHLYVTPFVRPARPESASYPNRAVAILTVGLACFFVWTIGLLIVRSIREHLA
jgi:capsular polysaccharide transport system permease protein